MKSPVLETTVTNIEFVKGKPANQNVTGEK